MTEKSSLTASAVASKLDANVNFIQGPCRAAGINAFKAQCIPPAQLVVLILFLKGSVPSPAPHPFSRKAGCFMFEPNIFCKYFREQSLLKKEPYLKIKLLKSAGFNPPAIPGEYCIQYLGSSRASLLSIAMKLNPNTVPGTTFNEVRAVSGISTS